MEQKYIYLKTQRRETKRIDKRSVTGEEVIFIFEKILQGCKTVHIYNTIIQQNPHSSVSKKMVEKISTGNCKVFEKELDKERYTYYLELRQRVYEYHVGK